SIVDLSKYDPAIDEVYFPNTVAYYWSSTTFAVNSDRARHMGFDYGYDYVYYKSNSYYVRAVRGGQ
ncbi:MAG: DUF1566 domain-containing protein, partial [Pseudomonadota bacterium]